MDQLTLLPFEKPLRELEIQLSQLRELSATNNVDMSDEISAIESKLQGTLRDIYGNLTPWQKVQIARHPKRPYALDYIHNVFEDFQELHGDRRFKDDRAIVGGTAFFEGQPVMVIGQQKGRNTRENLLRNFGSPNPEGYRKALRLMEMAQKFGLPIITLIDTPGAYPGIGAEERHVAEAIAVNIREMSLLEVPIVTVILGEGGSGGALGMGLSDRVLIFENAYYSVISPEGCAAILWKDRARAADAAEALKLDAKELLQYGIVDEVLQEPLGGNHRQPQEAYNSIRKGILKHLNELQQHAVPDLIKKRYEKYRRMGVFQQIQSESIAAVATDSNSSN
jgi:acetyl-CoA carboxylase carboxyl transferase subunit alpha